jgi:hypothetical protein
MRMLAVFLITIAMLVPTFAADAAQPKPIDQLKWMVGSWEAQEGSGADVETVKLKAWLSPNGQAIFYHVDVVHGQKGTPRYDGMYYWDPVAKSIVLRQVAITGGASEGEYLQNGDRATQKCRVLNPDGTTSFIDADLTISSDRFHFVGKFKAGEGKDWIPAVDVTYRRVPVDAPAK